MISKQWTLLLFELPTRQNTRRVSLWRKLKKLGAVTLKTSVYLLPDTPSNHEAFQWLAKQVRDSGGQASLIRATEIEGLSEADIVQLFNAARTQEYAELSRVVAKMNKRTSPSPGEDVGAQIDKLRARFDDIRQRDFFNAPAGKELLSQIEKITTCVSKTPPLPRLSPAGYQGKTWLTRPRPEIDRVGSAWFIRKFIDPKARFVFDTGKNAHPGAVSYDMLDADFTHHGDNCTFEVLVHRFGVKDQVVLRMAQMVHEADLNDGKFPSPEAHGLHRVLQGLASLGWDDGQIMDHGFLCFDALYANLKAGV